MLDEAKQFAAIFSMTSYTGYILRGSTYFFNVQRDEQGWYANWLCGGGQNSLEPPKVGEFSLQDSGKTMSSLKATL